MNFPLERHFLAENNNIMLSNNSILVHNEALFSCHEINRTTINISKAIHHRQKNYDAANKKINLNVYTSTGFVEINKSLPAVVYFCRYE